MRAKFIRGTETGSREEIIDKVFNRKITIVLAAANVFTDKNEIVSRGIHEDTDYFLDVIEKSGADWKQLNESPHNFGGVPFEFTGTKEQLIPILVMWDASSRTEEELTEALEDWDGSEKELWNIIG